MNAKCSHESLLRLVDVDFGYAGRPIVRGITLSIEAGEFVAMVGANGSGKTTLVRGLLGLIAPLGGQAERRADLRMGYVPQRESLDPLFPLSGRDVAMMGACCDLPFWHRVGAPERARANDALEATRALAFAGQRYSQLSGGQRQRILIARALATQPSILLLDEPTAGVDPDTEKAIVEVLHELRIQHGMAIWIVTHQLQAVLGRVDRVIKLQDGRLVHGGVQ